LWKEACLSYAKQAWRGENILKKEIALITILVLFTLSISSKIFNPQLVKAWSNGGFSADPNNPDYGTHDWIAQHALDWLPAEEKQYILDNLTAYLYGTELPDNGGAPDGIGDSANHHAYFDESETLVDDSAAFRAQWEYEHVLSFLDIDDLANASKTAGLMSHYLADVAVFGHVMGANTPWGAEQHHSDYETYVNTRTNNYTDEFNSYLSFDGSLDLISAYNATKNLAYDTTFDVDGELTCVWMDQNYNWSDQLFRDRAGESLNLAVNYLADVLHTLYSQTGTADGGEKFYVFPTNDVGLIFENVTAKGSTTVNKTETGPEPPPMYVVKKYYNIETTANYSDKIQVKIVVGSLTPEEEASLQLMQWNETTQQWVSVTTYIDVSVNLGDEGSDVIVTTYLVVGETGHLSAFGITCANLQEATAYYFPVDAGTETFNLSVKTNSAISNFTFDENRKTVSFDVEGATGTKGFCSIAIPEELLGGPYTVKVDDKTILQGYSPPKNGTHAFMYVTYNHSLHTVKIIGTTAIPEFPSHLIIPLFTTATLLAVIIYRRKHLPQRLLKFSTFT